MEVHDRDDDLWVGPIDAPERYRIIGDGLRGGEGIVYQAELVQGVARPVVCALKQVSRPAGYRGQWPRGGDLDRWQGYVQLLRGARSPHLVDISECFVGPEPAQRRAMASDDMHAYLVMEWVDGQQLDQLVPPDGLPPRQAITLVRQLAAAAAALHSATRMQHNPMLHGDIKPQNCIVHPTRGLVLLDLGGLRPVGTAAPLGLFSPAYSAPEVLTDPEAPRLPASDVYSIGAVAYHLLIGHPPPPDATARRHELQRMAAEHRIRRPFSNAFLDILDAEPRRRPDASAWAVRLQELLDARPRRPAHVVATVLTAVVAVTLGAVLLVRDDSSAELPTSAAAPTPLTVAAFGQSFAAFPTAVADDQVTITPPLGADRYDHLWGVATHDVGCAALVEFDVTFLDSDPTNGFGIGVAPRAMIEDDQPVGDSMQYEWRPTYVTGDAGSFVRPVMLPGGAWAGSADPVQAPDIKTARRHVVVRAVGTSLTMTVDGVTARYTAASGVQCGVVALRAWGAAVRLDDVRVSTS